MFLLFLACMKKSFLILVRNKIFIPIIITGVTLLAFSHLVSYWTISEYKKVLYDFLLFFLNIGGSFIAIYWGSQSLLGSGEAQANEMDLTAPIPRYLWLLASYAGLGAILICLMLSLMVFWQLFILLQGFSWLNLSELHVFSLQALSWLLIASFSLFYSCFCQKATALFVSLCTWLGGMIGPLLVSEQSTGLSLSQKIIHIFSKLWNFQSFNLLPSEIKKFEQLSWIYIYGLSLCSLFLLLSCLIFQKKDIR